MRLLLILLCGLGAQAQVSSGDLSRFRSAGDVQLSPDGTKIAYTVTHNDRPGRPYSTLHVMPVSGGSSVAINGSGNAVWSPSGEWIAHSTAKGLAISRPDGTGTRFIHALDGTNAPLPTTGKTVTWSPDSKQIAFVHALPGPETEASGDPMVITRYLYKPDAGEGNSRFNDNKRLHIFVADVGSGEVRQLTKGDFYEHSIDWSPDGSEILFVSNREPDSDQFFNYDLWTVKPADGSIRRVTATENAEYMPRWSPDGKRIAYLGTKRGLTNLETTMEDTHVWTMNRDGSGRRESGAVVDNRQMGVEWAPDGPFLYFRVQERGSVSLYRLDPDGSAKYVIRPRGTIGSCSIGKGARIAYTLTTDRDMAQVYTQTGMGKAAQLTDLNADVLSGKQVAPVESFTFQSNDFRYEIEAFLTKPLGQTAGSKHPMIVLIHGGPHGQQGPAYNFRAQVYASRGWATLYVNYRGSTGYGQKFADGVFGDQNGNEGQDVLYAVSAAIRRNPWIDRNRLGVEGVSYGGQLSAWLVTQTHIFKAAIPIAAIINLVSYNYMTYYNMYEQMTFGVFPHQSELMDTLWKRSALRYVAQVKTPVMLMHGENDNDVCIAEAEQFYIGLKDVGVDTVMVRYPREGHGLRENKHVMDSIDRAIAWYEKYFPK